KRRREDRGQRTAFWGLHAECLDAHCLRVIPHAVEQDGLADTAETNHQDALCGSLETRPLNGDADSLEELIAPGQLRRRRAGPRCERVANRVHGPIIAKLANLGRFMFLT